MGGGEKLEDPPPPARTANPRPLAGRRANAMVAVERKAELGKMFDDAGGAGKPRVGQLAVAYDTDRDAAIQRAVSLVRPRLEGERRPTEPRFL